MGSGGGGEVDVGRVGRIGSDVVAFMVVSMLVPVCIGICIASLLFQFPNKFDYHPVPNGEKFPSSQSND